MSQKILIVQADAQAAQSITDFFSERGDQPRQVESLAQAQALLAQDLPNLAVIDLHLLDDDTSASSRAYQPWFNGAKVLFTSRYPDPKRELQAKVHGAKAFLRPPFTRPRLEEDFGP